jgi:nitronate monooxygenase
MGVGISLSGLAAAVADAGGVGVIAANAIGLMEPDYYADGRAANIRALRRELQTARQKTHGVLGVNIMVAVNDFHELLDVAIEEGVDLVFMGAGLPIKGLPVERMRKAGVRAVPIVSSARAVEMIFRMWSKLYGDVPDAVVVEGPLAGGHLGFSPEQIEDPAFKLEALLPGIVDAVRPFEEAHKRRIPVIAAGGVFTGADIFTMLSLGASGVQMGTRFVATDECDAHAAFKQAYVDATAEQIGLIDSPVGMPGRAIRNEFILASEGGQRPEFKCAWQCLASCKADGAHYCISVALNNARQGRLRNGFVFAGANAHRVERIVPVSVLVHELLTEYQAVAGEKIAGWLEAILTRLHEIRDDYYAAADRARELRLAYESALTELIHNATSAGIAAVREQYDAALANVRRLQFQLAEKTAACWAAVRGAPVVGRLLPEAGS